MKAAPTVRERFEAKVERVPGGCWLWTGSKDRQGYGKLSVNRRPATAHRLSYEFYVGPIPPGLVLDHLCRVTSCVNPEHLEAVTQHVNLRRGAGHGTETHCPRGHAYDEANTYRDSKGHRRCRECARIRDAARRPRRRVGR